MLGDRFHRGCRLVFPFHIETYINQKHKKRGMPRGRPPKSPIRQNIVDLLAVMKKGYGYDIYKHYKQIFPQATMRSIYYQLKRGLALGEIKVQKIEKEKGEFSWGSEVEKVYYELGLAAKPRVNHLVKEFFDKRNKVG